MKEVNWFNKKEHGAVSLFIVIFSTLLISVLTVSFIRMMVRDQQEATLNDLSQSAYDSALAGVEDAKRALLRYQNSCGSDPVSPDCEVIRKALNSGSCDTLEGAQVVDFAESSLGNKEVIIQKDISDDEAENFDQAYTCVTMTLNTPDYQASLSANESKIIPLRGVSDFNSITIQWFTSTDANSSTIKLTNNTKLPLPISSEWETNQPAFLRAQLIQYDSSFSLSDFDTSNKAASTLFLYPSSVGTREVDFSTVPRAKAEPPNSTGTGIKPIHCVSGLANTTYACTVKIKLSDTIHNGSRTALLRLSALYNKTTFRITLADGTVSFNEVQPKVDATGRANDVFRRVEARIETQSEFPYPEAAIDITGSLCKDFVVSTEAADGINKCAEQQ
jgi:Tfp pilus assembly protein PilX